MSLKIYPIVKNITANVKNCFFSVQYIPETLFIMSLIFLGFISGILVTHFETFPYGLFKTSYKEIQELSRHWQSFAGLRPTGVLVAPSHHEGDGVTVNKKNKVWDGLTLMSGLYNNKIALQLIEPSGEVVKFWNVDFFNIWPSPVHVFPKKARPRGTWGYQIQGMAALEDGSIVFNVAHKGLVKLDRCGMVVWTVNKMTHHSVFLANDGTFWVPSQIHHAKTLERFPGREPHFLEDRILNVSEEGKIIREISFLKLLFDSGLYGLLASSGELATNNGGFTSYEPTHINDIEVFSEESQKSHPNIKPGDLLVSSRNLNLLIAFDPVTLEVRWWQMGPWLRQHDPDILPNGRISIFNNNPDHRSGRLFGGSNIMEIDPATRAITVTYPKGNSDIFYTEIMGTHQYLPNRNLLITESREGRVFEVTERGEIVWEYVNRFDEDEVGLVEGAQRYDRSFFNVSEWSCVKSPLAKKSRKSARLN